MRESTIETGAPSGNANPALRRRARALRPWRRLLVLYGVLLTSATHWPRLQLAAEGPASDKMIHLLAFGILTLLLWRSGWLRWRWLVGVVALAWAGLDELTQGIPVLHRTVSSYDMIANFCGVLCAMAMLLALRPLHSKEQLAGPTRIRIRLFEFTFDEMFAHRQPWIIALGMLLACAGLIMISWAVLFTPRVAGIVSLVVVIVAVHVLYLIYRGIFFARLDDVLRAKPCLDCGAHNRPTITGEGRALCVVCGADLAASNYVLPPRPALRAVLGVSLLPAIVALLGLGALFTVVLLVPHLYGWTIASTAGRSSAPRLAHLLGRMPREVNSVIDLTIYTLLIALVVRLWRGRMAAHIDRGVRCRRCGHDLHGTPTNERGEGQCGECGEPFVRPTNRVNDE